MRSRVPWPTTLGTTATQTGWALSSEIAQLVLGLGFFFLLARSLGTEQFGVYGAVQSLGLLALNFAHLGSQQLMMRDRSRQRPFNESWSRTLAVIAGLGTLVAVVLSPAIAALDPTLAIGTTMLLLVAQVVLFGIVDFGVIAAQAHRDLQMALVVRVAVGVIRLGAVAVFWRAGDGDLSTWALWGGAAWAISALVAVVLTSLRYETRPFVRPSWRDAWRGRPYVLTAAAATALDSSDRAVLVGYGFSADAGLYGAGARISALAGMPLMALIRATDLDFYEAGARSGRAALAVARRLLPLGVAYGLVAAVAMWLLADIPAALLGDDFGDSADVIRLLCLLPLFRAIQTFAANALTGSDLQHLRNRAIFIAVAVNLALNLAVVPRWGWRGAVLSTLVAEALLAGLVWWFLTRLARTETEHPRTPV